MTNANAVDISQLERPETAMRERAEYYGIMFDLGPVAISSIDTSGVIRTFNRRRRQ